MEVRLERLHAGGWVARSDMRTEAGARIDASSPANRKLQAGTYPVTFESVPW